MIFASMPDNDYVIRHTYGRVSDSEMRSPKRNNVVVSTTFFLPANMELLEFQLMRAKEDEQGKRWRRFRFTYAEPLESTDPDIPYVVIFARNRNTDIIRARNTTYIGRFGSDYGFIIERLEYNKAYEKYLTESRGQR